MTTRYSEMGALLEAGKYFNLVCSAGNENADEVRKLALIYTLAGCKGFQVSANPTIVEACVAGVDTAYKLADKYKKVISIRPFVSISVGTNSDCLVRKAIVIDSCIECGKCIPVCPTEAITDRYEVVTEKCVGCGNCEAVCPPHISAIRYEHNAKKLAKVLPECIALGAENIELHACIVDNETIMAEWEIVSNAQPDNYIFMCLNHINLSNTHLIERIRQAKLIAGDRLVIQADGVPKNDDVDNLNSTLQTIAIADIINKNLIQKNKKFRKLPLLLSGGTNSKTRELANLCDISFAGISVGSHARKIVKKFVDNKNFDNDFDSLGEAVEIAEELVNSCVRL